jgi:hypothetical protein
MTVNIITTNDISEKNLLTTKKKEKYFNFAMNKFKRKLEDIE